jgi:hypothetical protein
MTTAHSKVLLTGAKGNVGMFDLKALQKTNFLSVVFVGARDVEGDSKKLAAYEVGFQNLDFNNSATYKAALQHCNNLFLLSPP